MKLSSSPYVCDVSCCKIGLIVEDDPLVLRAMTAAIRIAGLEAISAKNSVEAVAFLQQRAVDVVLMDVNMPYTNGLEVLREIRSSNTPYRDVPIFLMSGAAEWEQQAMEDGATCFLKKPLSISRLRAALDSHVLQASVES